MLPTRWLLVHQDFPDLRLADPGAETSRQLEASGLASRVPAGAPVAIGVGSRGIADIAIIVERTVRYWRDNGRRPFIFTAMGSHGAATPAGQADVLAHFGITEAEMGCPIVSALDVVSVGRTDDGIEAFMDKAAWDTGAVMIVGRVKWHTNFTGRIESGLFKMMAIGLGKFAGAQMYHAHAKRLGLEHVVVTVGRQVLQSGKMLGGVAILEDGHHRTARVDVVPAEQMEAREVENLALVKSWMARLPCDLDVLIVDEMGKNISGTGMDAKVVNRGNDSDYNPWPGIPAIERLFVRALHPLSYGSGVGIGMADVTTDRLAASIDWGPTLVNALAAGSPARVRLPMHFPNDRDCLERVAPTVGKLDASAVTFGWIQNTLALDRIAVSENLRDVIEAHPLARVEGEMSLRFDGEGNLVSPFERHTS
jgi:hypothetical protein